MPSISKEELFQNYEWKIIKKIILQEFPWIIDLDVDPSNLEIYSTIFVDLIIDPFVFSDTYNVKIKNYVLDQIEKGEKVDELYLSLIFNISEELESEIFDKIYKLVFLVVNSKSLPDELRFSTFRPVGFDKIIIKPSERFIDEAKSRLNG